MGCLRLTTAHTTELGEIHCGSILSSEKSSTTTYSSYPGGMAMPGRNLKDAEGYRYGYQGQYAETDPETGKPAFELRLYDSRINRWLSPDPYGQFASPYLGMGNNPANVVDPDGGFACIDADGNSIPCPNGYEQYNGPTNTDAYFDNDLNLVGFGQALNEVVVSADLIPQKNWRDVIAAGSLVSSITENFNIGKLKKSGDLRIYQNVSNPKFRGNGSTKLFNTGKLGKIGGGIFDAAEILGDGYDVLTTQGDEQVQEAYGLLWTSSGVIVGRAHPVLGIVLTAGDIIGNTEWYHKQEQIVKERQIQERLDKGEFGIVPYPNNLQFRQWDGRTLRNGKYQ